MPSREMWWLPLPDSFHARKLGHRCRRADRLLAFLSRRFAAAFVVFHLAGTDDSGIYAFWPLRVGHDVLVSDSLPLTHLAHQMVFFEWSTVVWFQIMGVLAHPPGLRYGRIAPSSWCCH